MTLEKISKRPISALVPYNFMLGLFCTIFIHRNVLFSPSLPGDSFDARAILVVYEHWYSFLQGKSPLREVPIFFPAESTLGGSEASFAQGLIYSLFRAIQFDVTTSLKASVIFVSLIGLWGTAKLTSKFFTRKSLSIASTLLTATSYQLFVQSGHLQTWMYLNVSWVILAVILLNQKTQIIFAFGLIVVGLPVLALSTWYCVVAIVYFGTLYALFMYIFDPSVFKTCMVSLKGTYQVLLEKKTSSVVIISSSAILTSLFFYIYLPRVNDQSFGKWSEVAFYSPRLSDLINASVGSSGFLSELYARMKLDVFPTFERAMGLTVSTLLLILLAVIFLILKKVTLPNWMKSIYLAAFATLILPLTDERGLSLWYFVNQIPFMNSVRTPARFWTFSSIILTWISIWIIWNGSRLLHKSALPKFAFFGLLSVLIGLQVQSPTANWTEKELLSPYGQQSATLIEQNRCDYFYLSSSPELGLMDSITIQIDAMVIASIQERKTINGYTSAPPPYWPQRPIWGLVGESDLRTWLRIYSGKFPGTLCFVDESGLKILTEKSY